MARPLPLALTIGEPGGVGPDITLAVWMDRDRHGLPPFYCYADRQFLMERAREMGIACPMESVTPDAAVACFHRALPVVDLDSTINGEPGRADPHNAGAVIEAIAKAVGDIRAGLAGGIVTNPINKKALYEAGFRHPGHTEFLGTLSAAWTGRPGRPVMMLVGPHLRTVPVTIHIPHRDVAGALSRGLIIETGRTVADDLHRRFGIAQPRLAVAGLNPHAGEGGSLGNEERETIEPAIRSLRADGIQVTGPHSADALFHPAARATYDAAICMYHDQALIPAKTISFSDTVNVTLGLAFVRTSPDHGTALDIAGTGRADPSSLAAALRLAAELRRNESARSGG